jgi:opacity protein-like surface antigen
LKKRFGCWLVLVLASLVALLAPAAVRASSNAPEPVVLAGGWQLQDAAKAPETGAEISSANFKAAGWYGATVPGTVLTTLVNNHVYPEPLYGENNRPESIP